MSALTVGPNFRLLSSGDRLYAYSGVVAGDVSVPATVQLLKFENSGLRDMFLKIKPFFARPVSTATLDALGLLISIDGVTVYTQQNTRESLTTGDQLADEIELFIPKQSTFEVLSINTANNNTQERGCNALGWYL